MIVAQETLLVILTNKPSRMFVAVVFHSEETENYG
jgi:hypothetical protein